jgi:tetratricopeptide (TPR) repeat protein
MKANEHPTGADLDRLLMGDLPTATAGALLVHLIRGCYPCRLAFAHRAPFLDDRWLRHGDPPAALTPAVEAAYDLALTRAIEGVLLHGERVLEHKAQQRSFVARLCQGADPDHLAAGPAPGLRLPLFEALLERSWELRTEDPAEMVRLAQAASRLARDLGSDGYTPPQVADFAARAGGALGNALRIAERLPEAEEVLRHALETWAFGSRDAGLRARLLDFNASLLGMQRRLGEAIATLSLVHLLHLRRGDRHGAGRALISKSAYTGEAGRWEEALALLREGCAMLDPGRDPELRTLALHNEILFLAEAGASEQAWALLQRDRAHLEACGGRLMHAKLDWLAGRLHARGGRLEEAAAALERARRELEQVGLEIGAARAAVDLAAVRLQQGRAAAARAAAVRAVEVFLAHGIEGEGLAAVLTLREAFERELATVVLVQRVADFLRRLEVDPAARFG